MTWHYLTHLLGLLPRAPPLAEDPHNNGTYTVLAQSDALLEMQRVTGDKK